MMGVEHPSIDLSTPGVSQNPSIPDTMKLDNKQSLLARHSEKISEACV